MINILLSKQVNTKPQTSITYVCTSHQSIDTYLVFFDNLKFDYKREIILSIKPENSITEVI